MTTVTCAVHVVKKINILESIKGIVRRHSRWGLCQARPHNRRHITPLVALGQREVMTPTIFVSLRGVASPDKRKIMEICHCLPFKLAPTRCTMLQNAWQQLKVDRGIFCVIFSGVSPVSFSSLGNSVTEDILRDTYQRRCTWE